MYNIDPQQKAISFRLWWRRMEIWMFNIILMIRCVWGKSRAVFKLHKQVAYNTIYRYFEILFFSYEKWELKGFMT